MISIQNLCKSFDDKALFENYNIDIADGEFLIFAGNSGCGKTTLLNMIGGLELPNQGAIIVDGIDICKRKNKRDYFMYKVGFLFQNFALLENQTVRQNLDLIQKKARTERSVFDVLEDVGLSKEVDAKVYKLSGGEQQRVALARLMLKKCDIILADEPTGSLDAKNADTVMEILHKMNDQGKTIIIVTHSDKIINSEKKVVMLG
jgi:putative ABC transport system ATP-binding protein